MRADSTGGVQPQENQIYGRMQKNSLNSLVMIIPFSVLTGSPWEILPIEEMGGPMTPPFLGGLGVYHDPFQCPRGQFAISSLHSLRNGLAIFYRVNLRSLKMTLLRSPWPQCHSTFWDLWKCGKKDSNNFWPPYTVEAGAASIEKKDPKLGGKKNGFDSITETSEGDFFN